MRGYKASHQGGGEAVCTHLIWIRWTWLDVDVACMLPPMETATVEPPSSFCRGPRKTPKEQAMPSRTRTHRNLRV